MKFIDKVIVAIGALDVGYIAWMLIHYFGNTSPDQVSSLWESIVSFGLPFPELQLALVGLFYSSILACGLSLLIKKRGLVWLNYAQFPFRILLVVPTLYPLFYLVSKAGLELGVGITFGLLIVIESSRVYLVFKWKQYGT